MSKRTRKFIFTLLKLLLSSIALYIVFRKIDLNELKEILSKANLALLFLAIVFFVFSKIVSAFRLNFFLRDEQVSIPEVFNLKLYLLGMYYNLFLPGGIGGDGYKIYLLNKLTKIRARFIFRAVLMDRITGVVALVIINLLLSYFLPVNAAVKYMLWITIPLIFLVFYIVSRRYFKNYMASFWRTSFQAFAVQLLQLVSILFIMLAIGIHTHYGLYLFVFLVSSIIATIPFTIGGVGARELTFLISANLLGLMPEQSLAISLLFFLVTAFVSLFGMIYSFKLDSPPEKIES